MKLDIAADLAVGVYEVKLLAINATSSYTFTFTLTVVERLYYIDIPKYDGGAVSAVTKVAYLAAEGELVTLTIKPDTWYEVVSIDVYDYYKPTVHVPLSGAGLTRTFTMPAHHVTIAAIFRNTLTDIDDIQSTDLRAYVQDGSLFVYNLMVGKSWSVFNMTGTLIYQDIANSDKAEILLPGRGVYIVRSETELIKVNY
jgi:hypothetical protein